MIENISQQVSTTPKNIAIVIDSIAGGGAEKVMITLSKALISLGHKVSLLSLGQQQDYEIPEEISFSCLFSSTAKKVDRFWAINQSVKKLESWFAEQESIYGCFDLVLSNLDRSNNLFASSSLFSKQLAGRIYYIVHNSITEELVRQKKLGFFAYQYLKRAKLNLSGKSLITVSKGIEQEVLTHDEIEPQTVRTIYNPFDFEHITRLAAQDNPQIPAQPYIIHVGRLAKQKRHDILFRAFKQLPAHYRLVLLCNNTKKALKLAQQYGIVDRLILPGFQQNPYNWIKRAQLLVLSSDYEGFGNVLVEALSLSTKVVSTNCHHGPSEILTGELAQFLVPRRDAQALTYAMKNALEQNIDTKKAAILEKVAALTIAKQYLALCQH